MSLPPLSPVLEVFLSCLPKAPYRTGLTEQIEAYGKACRATALEEAAGVIEADIYPAPLTAYQKQYNAGIALRVLKIRRMK